MHSRWCKPCRPIWKCATTPIEFKVPMLSWLFNLNKKRRRLLDKAPAGPIQDYLSQPFPDRNCPISNTALLAMDFETSGLNAKSDHLLSVGYVTLQDNRVILASAHHQIIHSKHDISDDNISIHRITHDQV
ncbi:MAG TPA: hypothetical protein ENG92_03040, partial [Thiolapillus brandeum]|nr:hypothetical protein [Thiolapillus brandeum]